MQLVNYGNDRMSKNWVRCLFLCVFYHTVGLGEQDFWRPSSGCLVTNKIPEPSVLICLFVIFWSFFGHRHMSAECTTASVFPSHDQSVLRLGK